MDTMGVFVILVVAGGIAFGTFTKFNIDRKKKPKKILSKKQKKELEDKKKK